ncbi:hypothetical protein DRE_03210 [Drechslerella stenobrocha 248]|uniref:Kinetochore protein fta7 n=1 Tax=Drechslerella stenobrocha 248 TaxID=1043628 RepID=W7IEY4_9PEZI|nr:hypothetical protein DRE_03210 [Drechslerella stenobrocha 248]
MPRPPRRVPSKKTAVAKGRVTKSSAKAPTPRRRKSDPVQPAAEASADGQEQDAEASQQPKRRRVSGGAAKKGSTVPHLVARKKKVTVEDFENKWVTLSSTSVAEISKVLRDVGRSVMLDMPLKSAAKRDEAQKTLDKSYQKFERSLSKMKIAPATSEKVFSNEWLINEEARLNGLIQPEVRQISMLQKEINKQRRLLEAEERQLLSLKKNATAEQQLRRQKAAKFIPALKTAPVDPDQLQIEIDKIRLDTTRSDQDFTIAQDLLEGDEELQPTMRQLQKHLGSMARNRQALGDIPGWMQSTRAAVDDVLYQLKGDRYGDFMDLTV